MFPDMFKLDGRVALITGGNRGLGFVMATALAEAGADVVVTNRQIGKAQESAAAIATATGSPGWIGVDSSGSVTLANRWAWNDGRLVLRLDGEPLEVTWIAERHSSVRTSELPPGWMQ